MSNWNIPTWQEKQLKPEALTEARELGAKGTDEEAEVKALKDKIADLEQKLLEKRNEVSRTYGEFTRACQDYREEVFQKGPNAL